jgi:hypothetical protein
MVGLPWHHHVVASLALLALLRVYAVNRQLRWIFEPLRRDVNRFGRVHSTLGELEVAAVVRVVGVA